MTQTHERGFLYLTIQQLCNQNVFHRQGVDYLKYGTLFCVAGYLSRYGHDIFEVILFHPLGTLQFLEIP